MSKIFETSDEEVTNPATSLAKASQALALLDVSQEGHGLDSSISVSSKNPFEDKASTLQTELPAILENASQHSLQSKDGNPGKRPVLPQLELSPAAKQRRGLIAALQRHAMEVHVDIMVPGSVDDVDGTEKRVKASISTSKSPNGTGKSAEMEWKDLELLPERTVNQDIQILDSGRDENRNIDSTSAENTYGSPDSTGDDATPKASIRSVQAIVTPMKKTVYETHILRDMKGPCCSSNSPDKTCKPRIAASIPSHETESGFEPVTAIRLRRGRSHRSVASPPDRDVLELGTQQGADGQKSVNDTSIEGVDYQHDPRSTQTAKHNQGRKRQRKYTVRSSGSPVRTDDDTADAEFSVGEVQVLQVEQMVFRFSSPNPEIHLTSPSALSRSISSYASAKSTIQATMRASGLTEADDPFISKPEEEISILQRNLDECAKVDQQSDNMDVADTIPFTSSSTSCESQTSSAPTLENDDDFMDQWEASLGPEQRTIFRIMLRAAQKAVSKLIDSEDVISELASSYGSSLAPLFKELVSIERNIAEQKRRRSLEFLESYTGSIEKHIKACQQIARANNHAH